MWSTFGAGQFDKFFAGTKRNKKAFWKIPLCSNNYHDKTCQFVVRFLEHVLVTTNVRSGRGWLRLGVSMPISDVIQFLLEHPLYFPTLSQTIRNEGETTSFIGRSRSRGTLNSDHLPIESSE